MRTRDIDKHTSAETREKVREATARMKAERLEAEARRWAGIERFSAATLGRFARAIIDGAAGRDMQPVEGDLLWVLNRAIEIKKGEKK
jgi:hypothetical protein